MTTRFLLLLLLTSATCACSASGSQLRHELSAGEREGALVEAPFVAQESTTDCGASAAAALLGNAGVAVDVEALRERLVEADEGTYTFQLALELHRAGLYPWERWNASLDQVNAWLQAGRPVTLMIAVWPYEYGWRHFITLTGHDKQGERYLAHTGQAEDEVVSRADLLEAWQRGGRWALVALPHDLRDHRLLKPVEVAGLGLLAEGAKDLEVARRQYRAALDRDPSAVRTRANLAGVLLDLGRYAAAEKELRRCLRQLPGDPHVSNNLAWAIYAAGERDHRRLAEAAGFAQSAVKNAKTGALRAAAEDTLRSVEARLRTSPLSAAPSQG